ncbi:MAG: hybrid sensor histidine kinase/response regulator [Candidatus Sericytochromatia bacterium]|nr:hybrid sensor histidine kinase/response regulator [Candidatus Sericytochromatia bacterium]
MHSVPSSEPAALSLLIDDQVYNLKLLSESLRQAGYRLTAASNGQQALQLMQKARPDLILCDIMMPEMNGCEFAEQVQQAEAYKDIPLIFLTAKAESEDIVKGFACGGVDYIIKPFAEAELLARVQTHLQLKQARDRIAADAQRLAALNNEKDELLNIAAHDLKSPLAAIAMVADVISMRQGQIAAEKNLEYASMIAGESQRMLKIIGNLLDLNKIETGRIQPQWQTFNPLPVLQHWYQNHGPQAAAKQIILQADWPDSCPELTSDQTLLLQVLDNLLSNALKFSPPGLQVHFKLQVLSEALKLQITDQGPGFSVADRQRMYQKFARLSARPTGKENSTGLGLAIVRELCQRLGITISLTSAPGEGACFELLIPLQPETEHAD